jgi:hypothetical protein
METQWTTSIAELCDRVFPGLDSSTIRHWMRRGVFTPYRVERGRVGSVLDLNDCVAVGILHSLFTFGARFEDLQPSSLGYVGPDGLMDPADESRLRGDRRGVQAYLERTNCECFVYFMPRAGKTILSSDAGIPALTVFLPNQELDRYLERIRGRHGVIGHAFVNVAEWHAAVRRAFGF